MFRCCLMLLVGIVWSTACGAESLGYFAHPKVVQPCPRVQDFTCLVRNSFTVYEADRDHWWRIYRAGLERARSCREPASVSMYVRIYTAKLDGEMGEVVSYHSELFILNRSDCFLDGVRYLPSSIQQKVVRGIGCLLGDHATFLESVRRIKPNHKNRAIFGKVVAALDKSTCPSIQTVSAKSPAWASSVFNN